MEGLDFVLFKSLTRGIHVENSFSVVSSLVHFSNYREACFYEVSRHAASCLCSAWSLFGGGFLFLIIILFFCLFVFCGKLYPVGYIANRDSGDIVDNYIALSVSLDTSMSFFQVSIQPML